MIESGIDNEVFYSEQFTKLIRGKSCVASDSAHRECVDWIVAGYRDDSRAIGHYNVFTLTSNTKSRFLESPHGGKMVDPGDSWHA